MFSKLGGFSVILTPGPSFSRIDGKTESDVVVEDGNGKVVAVSVSIITFAVEASDVGNCFSLLMTILDLVVGISGLLEAGMNEFGFLLSEEIIFGSCFRLDSEVGCIR